MLSVINGPRGGGIGEFAVATGGGFRSISDLISSFACAAAVRTLGDSSRSAKACNLGITSRVKISLILSYSDSLTGPVYLLSGLRRALLARRSAASRRCCGFLLSSSGNSARVPASPNCGSVLHAPPYSSSLLLWNDWRSTGTAGGKRASTKLPSAPENSSFSHGDSSLGRSRCFRMYSR